MKSKKYWAVNVVGTHWWSTLLVFKKYDSSFSVDWQASVTGNFIGLSEFNTFMLKSSIPSPTASSLFFYQPCLSAHFFTSHNILIKTASFHTTVSDVL
jgi:hypothetical protein